MKIPCNTLSVQLCLLIYWYLLMKHDERSNSNRRCVGFSQITKYMPLSQCLQCSIAELHSFTPSWSFSNFWHVHISDNLVTSIIITHIIYNCPVHFSLIQIMLNFGWDWFLYSAKMNGRNLMKYFKRHGKKKYYILFRYLKMSYDIFKDSSDLI